VQTKQRTVTREGEDTELRAKGRHDPCVVPRGKPWFKASIAPAQMQPLVVPFLGLLAFLAYTNWPDRMA
jgi:chorismate synthase